MAGRGRLFLISGEPGSGKTRLTEELTTYAQMRGATVVAAYSPRIRPGVTVSFPVAWDELEQISPQEFTVQTAPRLLEKRPAWADLLPMPQVVSRGLIEECGTDPETNGGLYRTTGLFLEKLGLTSLTDLPPLAPLLPDPTELDPAITDA